MTDPRHNLFRDGYELTAAKILRRLEGREDAVMCFVRPTGFWYTRSNRHEAPWPSAWWVGTYTASTPPEVVEDDLLERLRELQSRRAA